MKRMLAGIGLLLGTLGVALSLAVVAGVWWVHHHLQEPVAEIGETLSSLGADVHKRAESIAARIETSRDALHSVQLQIRNGTQTQFQLSDEDFERIAEIHAEVSLLIQQMQAWAEFVSATLAFFERVMTIGASALPRAADNSTVREDLYTTATNGHRETQVVADLLEALRVPLNSVHRFLDDSAWVASLFSVLERADHSLAALQDHTQRFASGVADVTAPPSRRTG